MRASPPQKARDAGQGAAIVVAVAAVPDDTDVRTMARAAGLLGAYCDHAEHAEATDPDAISAASSLLRGVASSLARRSGICLASAYRHRVETLEAAMATRVGRLDAAGTAAPCAALTGAATWLDAQTAQIAHDRWFHPDVCGMSRIDQVRHCTFHVAKLAGLIAVAADTGDFGEFRTKRLADVAVFAAKLSTLAGAEMPDEAM